MGGGAISPSGHLSKRPIQRRGQFKEAGQLGGQMGGEWWSQAANTPKGPIQRVRRFVARWADQLSLADDTQPR